jgi:hypothetical protein
MSTLSSHDYIAFALVAAVIGLITFTMKKLNRF